MEENMETNAKETRTVFNGETARVISKHIEELTLDDLASDIVLPADLIASNARKIIELQTRGAKLRAIYRNLVQNFNLNVSYNTFTQYLSAAAVTQGIKRTVRPRYACPECRKQAKRYAFPENKGHCWQCPACKTNYYDRNGRLSARQYPPKVQKPAPAATPAAAAPATATASTTPTTATA